MLLPLALLPVPRQQFLDPNGAPYSNGSLQFFEAGTDTPLEVWADADGSTSLGTEVDLDSGGLAPAIYISPTSYKFKLLDEDDVVVFTQDQVSDPAFTFFANLGQYLAVGSKGVTTGYEITDDDSLVTVDEPITDPAIVILQPADERTAIVIIQNQGATAVAVTPTGVDTINGVAGAFSLIAASSPTFPTVVLIPDGISNYTIIALWGNA